MPKEHKCPKCGSTRFHNHDKCDGQIPKRRHDNYYVPVGQRPAEAPKGSADNLTVQPVVAPNPVPPADSGAVPDTKVAQPATTPATSPAPAVQPASAPVRRPPPSPKELLAQAGDIRVGAAGTVQGGPGIVAGQTPAPYVYHISLLGPDEFKSAVNFCRVDLAEQQPASWSPQENEDMVMACGQIGLPGSGVTTDGKKWLLITFAKKAGIPMVLNLGKVWANAKRKFSFLSGVKDLFGKKKDAPPNPAGVK